MAMMRSEKNKRLGEASLLMLGKEREKQVFSNNPKSPIMRYDGIDYLEQSNESRLTSSYC